MTIAILFIVLLLIGVPVAFTLGLTALAYIALETPLPPLVAFQRMFASVDSFPFVAIPFFMLAGNLLGAGNLRQEQARSQPPPGCVPICVHSIHLRVQGGSPTG